MWTWECCNGLGYGRYCWWKQLLFAAERWSALEHCKALELLWQYLWPEGSAITSSGMPVLNWTYRLRVITGVVQRDSFSYCVEKYHATLFHTQPPQNKYSRPPHLNKSQITSSQSPSSFTMSTHFTIASWLSVEHTKPVKAPAYTRALPDIGNSECVSMLIEHSAAPHALLPSQCIPRSLYP